MSLYGFTVFDFPTELIALLARPVSKELVFEAAL